MGPKVFRMNDCDWWAAHSLEEATSDYLRHTGIPEDEALDDPCELTKEEMTRIKYYDEQGAEPRTFADQLKKMVEEGEKFPCFFASTEY